MKKLNVVVQIKRTAGVLLLLALTSLLISTNSAWAAGPDTAAFADISTNPSGSMSGQNWNLTNSVNADDTIALSFKVGSSGTGDTNTGYPDTLYLTATTNSKPSDADDVSVTGLTNCTLTSAQRNTTPCNESVTITAPTTPGAYQVKILADDGRTGGTKMNSKFFFVNFVVAESNCTAASTTLVLGTPACTLYHANSVTGGLTATLMSGTTPLKDKTITFYVDGIEVGTADTNSSGVATLTSYDPSSLTPGNHGLTARWDSDDACYQDPAVTGSVLGIEYFFIGFQPPINADGTSILTGKGAPVKVRISDANANEVPDANALVFFADEIQAIVGTDPENVTTGLNFDYGNVMRYDATADQYVYNWDLSTVSSNGTKTVRVFLGEGDCADPRQVVVSVNRKKK